MRSVEREGWGRNSPDPFFFCKSGVVLQDRERTLLMIFIMGRKG